MLDAPEPAFARCDACGRRVRRARPVCPAHGPVPLAELDPGRASPPHPRFPGYRVLGVLGRGGYGTVFAAEPETSGPKVAIKLGRADRPDAALRLVHEIAALSAIGPPHVPALYGSGELADGSSYAVMEHLEIRTLADRLADDEPLAERAAIGVAVAVLRALEAVHARGWVHRDLKPENVFVDGVRGARIVDFGLVAQRDPGGEITPSSGDEAVGTAEYMAPEQCERRGDIDARADLYAMGVILYEMLAGAPPFRGPPAAVQQGHLARRPLRLSMTARGAAVPRALEEVVHRCLAKARGDRYPSAAALRAALERATAHDDAEASPPSHPAPAPFGAAPAAALRRGSAREERRTMSLLFFETDADALAVQKHLVPLGGQLAHASGGRYVVAYGHDLGDNPTRPALRAGHELIRRGLSGRVRIDVGPVSVQPRPDGSKRFVSTLFARADRFPSEADPPGVSVTEAAAAVLADPVEDTLPGVPPARRRRVTSVPPGDGPAELEPTPPDMGTDPFIGRDAILEALRESACAAAATPVPTMVSVLADAGHGKSRLFRALGAALRRAGAGEVIELRAREPALGGADQALRELLLRTLDLPAVAPPDGGGHLLRERLSSLGAADAAPVVAAALGWSAVEAGRSPLGAAPGALRAALTAAAGEALRRRAALRPVMLLLDDAHHADDATLAALSYAALAEGRAPLWICALARPVFGEEHPAWGERAGRRESFPLGPLDPDSAAALCRRLLLPIEDVPAPAVDRLVERAQGVPLLLGELVRGLRREGLVRRSPQGDSYYLATDELDRLPDLPLVEWLAQGEIDALPEALRAHAQLAALLGDEVSIPDLAGVLRQLDEQGAGDDLPLDAGVGVERLVAAGLLVAGKKRGGITFRHALVREAIAKEVPAPLRRRIHLAAAQHYRDGRGNDERRLLRLALHAARAELADEAEGAYLELAERMRARHAYVEAERCYSRALEQRVPGGAASFAADRRLDAYRGRGLMRYRVARYHDALADLSTARALAHGRGDVDAEVEILLDEATALDWMDEYRSSEERVTRARALLGEGGSPALRARLFLGIGRSLHRFSREAEAAPLLERAAAEAAALGDAGYETRVIALLMLGFIYQGLGRLDDAARALDGTIALCEEHGDDLHLAGAIHNRALYRACAGDRGEMLADMERALSLARKLGQAPLELVGQYNLGEYLYLMDDLDAAEPHVRRAVEIERRLRGDAGRPVVALLLGRLLLYRGDEAGARAIVARIQAQQAEARRAGQTDTLMVPSEEVQCLVVDLATRDAAPAEWDEAEALSARFSVGQERLEALDLRALSALRRGRPAEAAAAVARALAAATRIPNVMGARLARRAQQAEELAVPETPPLAPPRGGEGS